LADTIPTDREGSDFRGAPLRDVSAETLIVRWSDTGVFAVRQLLRQ
jgi:hypothetical protein